MNASNDQAFWQRLEQLAESCPIVIDRPKGSRHPASESMIYPVDYGYLQNSHSMDGEGIDLWVGTRKEKTIQGILCTVDVYKKDSEIKLLYACTEEEIERIYAFTNARDGMKGLLIRRKAPAQGR